MRVGVVLALLAVLVAYVHGCGESCAVGSFYISGKCYTKCPAVKYTKKIGCECVNKALIDSTVLIDFESFETVGYVPNVSGSTSGVTIASGIDLGARPAGNACKTWFTDIGVDGVQYATLLNKLVPYCNKKQADARSYLASHPLTISQKEAEYLNSKVKPYMARTVETRYNNEVAGKKFRDLPCGLRTVIVSVFFQYGNAMFGYNFWTQAKNSDWKGLLKNLRNFERCYCTRRYQEADIVDAALAQCPKGSGSTPVVGGGGGSGGGSGSSGAGTPVKGTLRVKVLNAWVPDLDIFSTSDPYAIVRVGDKRQDTSIKYDDATPNWQETLVFRDVRSDAKIRVEVYDLDDDWDDRVQVYSSSTHREVEVCATYPTPQGAHSCDLSASGNMKLYFTKKFTPGPYNPDDEDDGPSPPAPPSAYRSGWGTCAQSYPLTITATVGQAITTALASDQDKIRNRLEQLGFKCDKVNRLYFTPKQPESQAERDKNNKWTKIGWCILRFQSIVFGCEDMDSCAGKIPSPDKMGVASPSGETVKWLRASNAPRWIKLDSKGSGWEIGDEANDYYHWGTDWLRDVFVSAGNYFQKTYRSKQASPSKIGLLSGNDCSFEYGGGGNSVKTNEHSSHQAGIALDIRLPSKSGGSGGGGITHTSSTFDEATAEQHLRAMRSTGRVSVIYFNDPDLISKGLCTRYSGHDNHYHLTIKLPRRCDGATGSGSTAGQPTLDLTGITGAGTSTVVAPPSPSPSPPAPSPPSPSPPPPPPVIHRGTAINPDGGQNAGVGQPPTAGQSFWDCKKTKPVAVAGGGYCGMFTGGCCPSYDMVSVDFGGGHRAQVHKDASGAFFALRDVFARHDYQIRDAGGYCCRCIKKKDGTCDTYNGEISISNHAWGVAVDVNTAANPYLFDGPLTLKNGTVVRSNGKVLTADRTGLRVETDMPTAMIEEIRAMKTLTGKRVFRWGGDYTKKKDAMHFEIYDNVNPKELFDTFGGYDPNLVKVPPAVQCDPDERITFPSIAICPFNESTLVGDDEVEFGDPRETGTPLFNKNGLAEEKMSENFKFKEFATATKFRASTIVVRCMQAIRNSADTPLTVTRGYLTATELGNLPEVMAEPGTGLHHRSGHAFDVRFSTAAPGKSPISLAYLAVTLCDKIFDEEDMMLGIGLYQDYIHVDARDQRLEWTGPGAKDKDGNLITNDQFMYWVAKLRDPTLDPQGVPDCTGVASGIALGGSFPSDKPTKWCGKVDDQVQRDQPKAFAQLTRFISDNILYDQSDWANGYVTGRMDVTLRVFSNLLKKHMNTTNFSLLRAWETTAVDLDDGPVDLDYLYYEGRSVDVAPVNDTSDSTMRELSRLAICAGFDHVWRNSSEWLTLSVKNQRGRLANTVLFPANTFVEVHPPYQVEGAEETYEDPYEQEEDKVPLFDSDGREDEELSPALPTIPMTGSDNPKSVNGNDVTYVQTNPNLGFKVRDFLSRVPISIGGNQTINMTSPSVSSRYFRLLPELAFCIQRVEDVIAMSSKTPFEDAIYIKTAYQTREQENRDDLPVYDGVTRRHRSGRAVELMFYKEFLQPGTKVNDTRRLMETVVDRCGAIAGNLKGLQITIGMTRNTVYVDFRPGTEPIVFATDDCGMTNDELLLVVKERLAIADRLIDPFNRARACRAPYPQRMSATYTYENATVPGRRRRDLLGCTDSSPATTHCTDTAAVRQDLVEKVWGTLKDMVFQRPKADVRKALEDCLLPCDPCDKDVAMQTKLRGCATFAHWAPLAFIDKPGESNFYALDNPNTEELACTAGKCMKSSPLYGALAIALYQRYKPDSTMPQEELVYSHEDNPNPAIKFLQELHALHVAGNVTVWVADSAEISPLSEMLKPLMAYNKDVTSVTIKLIRWKERDQVIARMENHIDTWTNLCPDNTRSHVAPYTVEQAEVTSTQGRRRRDIVNTSNHPYLDSSDFHLHQRHDAWEFNGLF